MRVSELVYIKWIRVLACIKSSVNINSSFILMVWLSKDPVFQSREGILNLSSLSLFYRWENWGLEKRHGFELICDRPRSLNVSSGCFFYCISLPVNKLLFFLWIEGRIWPLLIATGFRIQATSIPLPYHCRYLLTRLPDSALALFNVVSIHQLRVVFVFVW